MKLNEFPEAVERLDDLIRRKQTCTPEKLAEKFGVSLGTINNLIKIMRNRGFPILYCRDRQTYYYEYEIEVVIFRVKTK